MISLQNLSMLAIILPDIFNKNIKFFEVIASDYSGLEIIT